MLESSGGIIKVMSEDQFTKLFKYMEQRFNGVDKKFEGVNHELADIRGAVGELGVQVRDLRDELAFSTHGVDKLRDATLQIAEETRVKLRSDI